MAIEDKIINAFTGSNIKTIRVSVDQLANIIYEQFVLNTQNSPESIARILRGKYFTYTNVDSPNGAFHLHISHFMRGLTIHRIAWVKNFETEEIFEWKGYTLGPLRRAFAYRVSQGTAGYSQMMNENGQQVNQGTGVSQMAYENSQYARQDEMVKKIAIGCLVVAAAVVGIYLYDNSANSRSHNTTYDTNLSQNDTTVNRRSVLAQPSPTPTMMPTPTPIITETPSSSGTGNIHVYNNLSDFYNSYDDEEDDDYYYDDEDDDYYDDYYDDEDDDYYDDYDYEDEYILPDSDSRKLTKSDLSGLSKEELRLARNEIYARHGRRFLDEELQEYFDSQSWYDGYIEPEDFVDSEELSKLERRNANFIKKFE